MKNVLVDFSKYNDLCGFGEIARNFAPRLSRLSDASLHYVFILPENRCGSFGSGVDYLRREHLRRDLAAYRRPIDLWHATDQQYDYRRHSSGTLQLLTVHDLNYLREKSGIHLLRHRLEMPLLIRRSHYITTISQYVRGEILRHIPFLNKDPEVIYNGIADLDGQPQQRPAFLPDDGRPFFLTVGQVRRKKNFHTLVPMMRHFPGHRLLICGDNHWPYADDIRRLTPPGREADILLPGKIADAEKLWLYAHCDAFLFPSTLEGFGIPVLEAMRFGAKVVSSKCTSLPEVCGCHASYWDSFQPDHMAQVVRQGLQGWSRQGQQARDARRHSLQFSYDHYTQAYADLYRRLLSTHKTSS